MTDQQIRLQFGELNAAEMRLARAIVGWHEREIAKVHLDAQYDWAEIDTAIRDACKKAGVAHAGGQDQGPDLIGLVAGMAAELAKLRAAADAMATAISSILCAGYPKGCNKPTEFEDRMLRSALAAYQVAKPA